MPRRFVEVADAGFFPAPGRAEVQGWVDAWSDVLNTSAGNASLGVLADTARRAVTRVGRLRAPNTVTCALLAAALAALLLRAVAIRLLVRRYLRAHGHARKAHGE